jgi:hypothetical protein
VGSKSLYYYATTFDLTGDGVNDLVLTYDQADAEIGNKHWLVYEGGASGFSTTATKWDLADDLRGLHGRRGFLSDERHHEPNGGQQVTVLLRHDL